jgi:hypothetical protein
MQDWSDFLEGRTVIDNVVPLRSAK